jgi:hypothetical protein
MVVIAKMKKTKGEKICQTNADRKEMAQSASEPTDDGKAE